MDGPNHDAIGAIVRVIAGDLSMMRLISAGTSYVAQEPAEAFFGLGSNTIVDLVTIEWPGGDRTEVRNLQADASYTISHAGEPAFRNKQLMKDRGSNRPMSRTLP